MAKVALLALLIIFAQCEVLDFNQETIDIVFKEKKAALFLFVSDLNNPEDMAAFEAFKTYDETNPAGIIFIVVSLDDGQNLYEEKLVKYLDLDVSTTPKVCLVD